MRLSKIAVCLIGFLVLTIQGCGGGGGGTGGGGATDTIAPTVSAFTLPATATSLTVAVSSFTATDNVAVTGYLITKSSTAPSASDTGWSSSVPTSFTFSNIGSKTAYAWAKDAAGNVSAVKSASVTITPADTTTATIIFTSQDSTNPSQTLGGFDLTLDLSALPAGAQIATDSTELTPLASAVLLSGAFASGTLNSLTVNTYDSSSRILTIKYPSSDTYLLGQFLTVKVTVPISYTPNVANINGHYTTAFYEPLTGIPLSSVTASATFN